MPLVIVFSVLLGVFLFTNIFLMVTLSYLDFRKRRKFGKRPFISFVVPVYNDRDYLRQCIKSIYSSYSGKFEVIIIDDASTDGSSNLLDRLKREFRFKLIRNRKNKGKSVSLNFAFSRTKGDIIFFVDSDMVINKKAVNNIIKRFNYDDKIGAVSCIYKSKDKGVLQQMQNLEYGYLGLFQGSFNIFSSLGLFGGCMAVRNNSFRDVGGFSRNAIIEDTDLALKLNKFGWRVEQSFLPVLTHPPKNLLEWQRQKIRWGSGFMQCLLKYPDVYFKNPIFYLFSLIFASPIALSLVAAVDLNLVFIEIQRSSSILLHIFLFFGLYPMFSIPYAFLNLDLKSNFFNVGYLYPFSLIYVPFLSLIYLFSFMIGFYKFFKLNERDVGWRKN